MGGRSGISGLLQMLRRKARGAATEVRYAGRKAIGSGEWNEPIRTMGFTALDCEMTGLDPARDEILSIGAVRIRNNRIAMRERSVGGQHHAVEVWPVAPPTPSPRGTRARRSDFA